MPDSDPLSPPQWIYAETVVAADLKCRRAIAEARRERDETVAEALATCQRVMDMQREAECHG